MTNTTTDGLGQAILHPKLVNRFRVQFQDLPSEIADRLSNQVTHVSSLEQGFGVEGGTVWLTFDDEISGDLVKHLNVLVTSGVSFTVHIDHLWSQGWSHEPINRFTLKGAKVTKVEYDELDYRGRDVRDPSVTVSLLPWVGEAIEDLSDELNALLAALQGAKLTVSQGGHDPRRKTSVISHRVTLSYYKLEVC